MLGKTIMLYRQPNGVYEGFMPAGVLAPTGATTLTLKDAAQNLLGQYPVTVTAGRYRVQNIRVSKAVKGLEPLPGEMEAVQKLKNVQTPVKYWSRPFVSPTMDCENSPFGVLRAHNGKLTGDYHKGVDLRSPMGRPVMATSAGVVVISQSFRLHGGTIGIDHGQGVSSIYIHLSKRLVTEGTRIQAGDIIGEVGATGFASGPHLHWGLYVNGVPVNPNQWLPWVPKCG
jgi:murein DD-endopeptidase MepM/ murein hydrolase activator NlpD